MTCQNTLGRHINRSLLSTSFSSNSKCSTVYLLYEKIFYPSEVCAPPFFSFFTSQPLLFFQKESNESLHAEIMSQANKDKEMLMVP